MQAASGFVGGLALGFVPFAGLGEGVARNAGWIAQGTREANVGKAVGEIVGGLLGMHTGISGMAVSGPALLSGAGTVPGAFAFSGSVALVLGAYANVATGLTNLQAAMSQAASDGGGGSSARGAGQERAAADAIKTVKPKGLLAPGKCDKCAAAIVRTLKARNISGELLQIRANEQSPFIVNDLVGSGSPITRNGYHEAVRVGDTVFDNYFRGGVPYQQYIDSLQAPFGVTITSTPL